MVNKKGNKGGQIDGVDTTKMTREQLERYALLIREELQREREERNYFQVERDKIATFWEISKQQIEEMRADLRNKDREIEERDERHQEESTLLKQKEKQLQYEHQHDVTQVQADSMMSLKKSQEDFLEQEKILLTDKKHQKYDMIEQQIGHQDEIRALQLEQSKEIAEIRKDYEFKARKIESNYDQKLTDIRRDLALRQSMELKEETERKSKQISDLMRNHEKSYTEMKNYFNDITLNNLSLIESLKQQMEEIKKREERTDKTLKETQKENKRLLEPMKKAKQHAELLKLQLINATKDKTALMNLKRSYREKENEAEGLKAENEALEIRIEAIIKERDEIKNKFIGAVLTVQQNSGLKSAMLEKKVRAVVELLAQTEAQFIELFEVAGLKTRAMQEIKMNVSKFMSRKNSLIDDLEYELARVTKAHDDLLYTYEGKLAQYGIPVEELGFTPLRAVMLTGKVPAGLVSVNK